MKLHNSILSSCQSFASVLLAFSLFGFIWPHHTNSAKQHHNVNTVKQNEPQQNDDDSWYTPPRSPGFHEDFGS
jgi:hypothetical protein